MDARRPDPILERHLLGELPPSLEGKAQAILATFEGRRRLEELKESDERILRELPPETAAAQIRAKLEQARLAPSAAPSRHWLSWSVGAGSVLALAAVALVAVLRPSQGLESLPVADISQAASGGRDSATVRLRPKPPQGKTRTAEATTPPEVALLDAPSDDGIRTKGEAARLRVHLVPATKGKAATTLLSDGDSCDPGEIVQVSIPSGTRIFAAVLSLDGNGTVTRHIPEQGDSAIPVQARLEAPHSFQLDEAPGFERFVLFTSDRPFLLKDAEARLRKAGGSGTLSHPADWSVRSLRLVKREGTLR
jgi:hypothetical protein